MSDLQGIGRSFGAGLAFAPAERQGDFFPHQPPSFPRLGAAADRIGVIDVGSNTVRLVVFEGGSRSPALVFNEKVMCALGAGLSETGVLDPRGIERAIVTLKRFAALAPALHVGALAGVATAAVRDARDGAAFRRRVEAETGIRLEIVTGETEARLAAQGVIFGNPRADGVVVDLGGASMELCRIVRGKPGLGISTPLGPLRLQAGKLGEKQLAAEFAASMQGISGEFALAGGRMYLVGGAWRALAAAHMARVGYPLPVLHEYDMTVDQVLEHAQFLARSDPGEIAALAGVSSSRAPVLPLAARLLRHLVEALQPGDVMVSGFGLREGVCLENMPPALRGQDPLMAACATQETVRARAPGFGAELADWVVQAVPPLDAAEERLVRASARLVDVNWRAHPDYRAIGCWEAVTRTSITDAGHAGRAFMGMILAARYKRARKALEVSDMPRLLGEAERKRALCFGSAFRFCAVLCGSTPGLLGDCAVERAPERLDLVLGETAAAFVGEEVEKRFGQLLRELKVDGALRIGAPG